tara:strand:- start:42 stop:746 length:705 start_codon:yes stop_codon:yes gene_type:complete
MSRSSTIFTDLPEDIQLYFIKLYCCKFSGVSKDIQAYCNIIYNNSATLLAKWYRSRRIWVELFIYYDPERHSLVTAPSFHLLTRKTMIRYFLLFKADSSLYRLPDWLIFQCRRYNSYKGSGYYIELDEDDKYFNSYNYSTEYRNNIIKEVRYFLTKYVSREQMKCIGHSSSSIEHNKSTEMFATNYIYNTYYYKLSNYNEDDYDTDSYKTEYTCFSYSGNDSDSDNDSLTDVDY